MWLFLFCTAIQRQRDIFFQGSNEGILLDLYLLFALPPSCLPRPLFVNFPTKTRENKTKQNKRISEGNHCMGQKPHISGTFQKKGKKLFKNTTNLKTWYLAKLTIAIVGERPSLTPSKMLKSKSFQIPSKVIFWHIEGLKKGDREEGEKESLPLCEGIHYCWSQAKWRLNPSWRREPSASGSSVFVLSSDYYVSCSTAMWK